MKIKCTCQHRGQDALHGAQMRVANPTAKEQVRCTVCKTLHNVSTAKRK